MGTKYSTVLVGGVVQTYNDNPPSDDGSQTEANRVKYVTVTGDLTAPLHSAIINMDGKLDTFVDEGPTTKATAYTTVLADHNTVIECSGTFTLDLLAPSGNAGYKVIAKNAGSGVITVEVDGGANVDGAASLTLTAGEAREFYANAAGTAYYSTSGRVAGSPITTQGDLIQGSASGVPERLSVGAADTFISSDGTNWSTVAAATEAEQEAATATNKPVTPGRLHFHPAVPKIVIRLTGVVTPVVTTLFTSGASDPTAVRNGIGVYTVTFNETFAAVPVCLVTGRDTSASQVGGGVELNSITTTQCIIRSTDENGANVDYDEYNICLWGEV